MGQRFKEEKHTSKNMKQSHQILKEEDYIEEIKNPEEAAIVKEAK